MVNDLFGGLGNPGGALGGKPKQEQKTAIEYTAQAHGPLINGEVKLKLAADALTITALFDAIEVPFAEINALNLTGYVVIVKADSGDYVLSKMGSWCQPFYNELRDTYNKAVLRSLFVKGRILLTAKGECRNNESGANASIATTIHVYKNSVVSLPPDLGARRVPLCFVSGMDHGDYELTLKLNTGEIYTYARLGYDTAPFADAVEKQIRTLREKSLAEVKEIDPSLTVAQASQIAKLMPQGASAQIGQLAAIAPSFVAALESELANTRAADSYQAFKGLCDPEHIFVGFKKNARSADDDHRLPAGGDVFGDADKDEAAPPAPYFLWLIAPSPNGQFVAVEFAETDSATFVFRTGGSFDAFARRLNRALEAIDFKREVIRMTDEALRKPENVDYAMAVKRTVALQFVRASFAGRIIHSGAETWKRKLTELWGGTKAAPLQAAPAQTCAKFCGECGAALTTDQKFCGACGAKI